MRRYAHGGMIWRPCMTGKPARLSCLRSGQPICELERTTSNHPPQQGGTPGFTDVHRLSASWKRSWNRVTAPGRYSTPSRSSRRYWRA